ncbi:hypothetical protein DOI34_24560 [Salmonella enterica subsp. enterica serovar Virchow]|nr:hypothetical protein [Salmonella enterica subsp. enterica serovar Virchow]
MKTTLIALAAVIGLSGAAFAADKQDNSTLTQTSQSDTLVTGSINQGSHNATLPSDGYASKAGIDVNPNFLPGL